MATCRLMTYNVHSCKGRDGRIDPGRIAGVVNRFRPDVLALQEVRRGRTAPREIDEPGIAAGPAEIEPPVGEAPLPPLASIPRPRFEGPGDYVDQPRIIAERTGMTALFYPLVRFAHEDYGIAILSRRPMRLVRAANLPTLPGRPLLERRGAIWVRVAVDGSELQVINTHLGLNRHERLAQTACLLGPEWSSSVEGGAPLVLLGDLNAMPWQGAYRQVAGRFRDAVRAGGRCRATFPASLPVLRIDHVFVGPGIEVAAAGVARTKQARLASDHLPVVADIRFNGDARGA